MEAQQGATEGTKTWLSASMAVMLATSSLSWGTEMSWATDILCSVLSRVRTVRLTRCAAAANGVPARLAGCASLPPQKSLLLGRRDGSTPSGASRAPPAGPRGTASRSTALAMLAAPLR
jgi:hypothetical protein